MDDRQAFLDHIADDPDDDVRRLVFSDWLQEHGEDDRAELIRIQIEDAKRTPNDPDREETRQRSQRLIDAHPEWREEVPRLFRNLVEFRRGFPTHLSLNAHQLMRHGGSLKKAIRIESLVLYGPDEVQTVLDQPEWFAGVRSLTLVNSFPSNYVVDTLVALPHLAGLTHFSVIGWQDGSLRAFADAGCATGLRSFTSRSMTTNPRELRHFFASRCGTGVADLDLSGCTGIGAVGLSTLIRHPPAPPFRSLNFSGCGLGDAGGGSFGRAALAGVEDLDLSRNGITATGIALLADGPGLANTRMLLLSGNPIGGRGLAALARSEHLGPLRLLDVSSCEMDDDGIENLAGAKVAEGLHTLRAQNNNRIGPLSFRALAESPIMASLSDLNLASCPLGDGAMSSLVADSLPSLRWLNLYNCGLGRSGAESLARWPGLCHLRALLMLGNRVGDEGARAILESPYLSPTAYLSLEKCGVSKAFQGEIRERFGERISF